MKKNKRKLIILITVIFLTFLCGMIFLYNNTQDTLKYENNKSPQMTKSKKKVFSKKADVGKTKQEIKDEEISQIQEQTKSVNNETQETKKIVENNKTTLIQKNSNQSVSVPQNNTQPSVVQNSQSSQAPSVIAQTEWEKLGISEYEYYNAKLYSWQEIAYKNIGECSNEAKRINDQHGFITNYGNVAGKYVNNVGCWVIVYVNGQEYYLNEFKDLGY